VTIYIAVTPAVCGPLHRDKSIPLNTYRIFYQSEFQDKTENKPFQRSVATLPDVMFIYFVAGSLSLLFSNTFELNAITDTCIYPLVAG